MTHIVILVVLQSVELGPTVRRPKTGHCPARLGFI